MLWLSCCFSKRKFISSIRHKSLRKSYRRLKVVSKGGTSSPAFSTNLWSDLMPQSLNEQLSREQQIAAREKAGAPTPRGRGVKRGILLFAAQLFVEGLG